MRSSFALSSSILVLAALPQPAFAQDVSSPAGASADAPQDIVITGSRIRQDGFSAPVPVTVLGEADIEAQKSPNIQDIVLTLPAISAAGSSTPQSAIGNFSAGTFGISSVNLRGLGVLRTLTLLDGRRTVASTYTGTVDANTFPQGLIKRVDVVTGGASAQYGSDAVGGVINYILQDKFKGLKLEAASGISTYGDGFNYNFEATGGFSLLDDRLHVEFNAEYFKQEMIGAPFNRGWNDTGYQLMNNPDWTATNGLPRRIVGSGIGLALMTEGGLITSGALRGTYFLPNGATGQLTYGAVSGPWMVGGDWQTTNDGASGGVSLIPQEKRIGVFNRISFDVTPDISIYGQFSWNRWAGTAVGGYSLATYGTGYAIQRDNAYLIQNYPDVVAAMNSAGLSSISVGTYGNTLNGIDNSREVFRYTAGSKGKFTFLDRPWSFDAYLHHGVTKTHEQLYNVAQLSRRALALDAVYAPDGSIVCRSSLTNPTNGCQPLNFLGGATPSDASLDYVFGEQPTREQTIQLTVAALDFSGELFDLPGGAVGIALGGEWREEKIDGNVSVCCGYETGNYIVNRGKQNVKEAFVELSLPVLPGLDLNPAARITDYSTSGTVETWKVGATYRPIPDITFRGSYSSDIRAPNLSELFNAGSTSQTSITLPPDAPTPGLVNARAQTVGNPNLKPEKAKTLTAGVVFTPRFIPGLSISGDYYDIKLRGGIGTITNQQAADFCYTDKPSQFCDNFVYDNGTLTTIRSQPVNFGMERLKGFEMEASYRMPLSDISSSLPGSFSIHASVNHPIKRTSDNLVYVSETVGTMTAPHWTYRVSAFLNVEPVTLNLVARGLSDGVYSNDYVLCTSGCPLSTTQNPTINDNHLDGAIYFDGSIAVDIPNASRDLKLTFAVRNILNRAPVLYGDDINAFYFNYQESAIGPYDTIGRTFRVAITTKF
jgi:iron complex outermembrane receptor protein